MADTTKNAAEENSFSADALDLHSNAAGSGALSFVFTYYMDKPCDT